MIIPRAKRTALLVLYQLCIVLGILIMPIALLTHRAGYPLPVHRLLARVGAAYEGSLEPEP